jgi:hypothetical protein
MTVYALSGVVLIFRDSDFLKTGKQVVKTMDASTEEIGKNIRILRFKANREAGNTFILRKEPTTKKPV